MGHVVECRETSLKDCPVYTIFYYEYMKTQFKTEI